ncbi:MAG: hypothetical protein IT381_29385 [Deltaproteobacteria bacterium]|nr:hypothetical protein [Deltaproteobacteria bacterium]
MTIARIGATASVTQTPAASTSLVDALFKSLERRRSANDRSTAGFAWPDLLKALGPKGRAGEIRTDEDLQKLPRDSRALRVVALYEGRTAVLRWVDTENAPQFRGTDIHHQELGADADGGARFIREGYIYSHQVPAAIAPGVAVAPVLPPAPKTEAKASIADLLASTRPVLQLAAGDKALASGLGVSPGGASGVIAFDLDQATTLAATGKKVVLVKDELRPDETTGLGNVAAIVTFRGGYSAHAAVVARERGVPGVNFGGVQGASLGVDALIIGARTMKAGDAISVDGSSGAIYDGARTVIAASERPEVQALVEEAKRGAKVRIFANADTPEQVREAKRKGALGVGLARSEHMFLENDARQILQRVLLAPGDASASADLARRSYDDFKALFDAADGGTLKIRLLDPPAHEFMPHDAAETQALAKALGTSAQTLSARIEKEREVNPMLGLRGIRLGIARPDIYETQIEAMLRAAAKFEAETGKASKLTIIVPMVSAVDELDAAKTMIDGVRKKLAAEGVQAPASRLACMIETPAAALNAYELAERCDDFCIGSNDLTQMTLGISRDDAARLPARRHGDPFRSLELSTVGKMIHIAVSQGRAAKPDLPVSLCGAQASDEASLRFLQNEAKVDAASVAVSAIASSWILAGAISQETTAPVKSAVAARVEAASVPSTPKPAPAATSRVLADRVMNSLRKVRGEHPQHSKKWDEIVAANPGEAGFIPAGNDAAFFSAITPEIAASQQWIRIIYGQFPEGLGFRFATEKALLWCMANTGHQGMDPDQKKIREGFVRVEHGQQEIFAHSY